MLQEVKKETFGPKYMSNVLQHLLKSTVCLREDFFRCSNVTLVKIVAMMKLYYKIRNHVLKISNRKQQKGCKRNRKMLTLQIFCRACHMLHFIHLWQKRPTYSWGRLTQKPKIYHILLSTSYKMLPITI